MKFDDELVKKLPGYEPGQVEYSNIVSEFLLRTAKVSSVPGVANGVTGASCVRFCFAASEDSLKKAVKQISEAVKSL